MQKYQPPPARAPGLSPGSLVFTGQQKIDRVELKVIDFDPNGLRESTLDRVEDFFPLANTSTTSWLNVNGLHDVDIIRAFGDHFAIHPLVLEDILNPHQRPKLEDAEEYLFVVLKMIDFDAEAGLTVEQVSLILGPHYLVTFQERPGDRFEPVRQRIRAGRSRIRKGDVDYLAYALIDALVDHYFILLDRIGDRIERIEERLLADPSARALQELYALKKDMVFLRRSIGPTREVIHQLDRDESRLIRPTTGPFLKDLYDHAVQVGDTVDTYRDMLSGLMDLYHSVIGNRMNAVMKVLTIIATIFIPLTFIAGIYGMNFEFMPELGWRWAYPAVWAVMVALGLGMFFAFKRSRWL